MAQKNMQRACSLTWIRNLLFRNVGRLSLRTLAKIMEVRSNVKIRFNMMLRKMR